MRALLSALLFLTVILAGCADKGPAPETGDEDALQVDPSDGLGAISGVVIDDTITPVAGASVQIIDGPSTVADEVGRFAFQDLEPGTYFLLANATGFESIQSQAIVEADKVTYPKIQLPRDVSPQPYFDSLRHEGFIQMSPGIGGFVIEVLAGEYVDLCACNFTFEHMDTVETYVFEVFYEETITGPVPHGGYYWELWWYEPFVDGQTGYGHNPINVHLDGEFYRGAEVLEARLTGPDEWISYQQEFEIILTRFHLEPAPEGWSILEEG